MTSAPAQARVSSNQCPVLAILLTQFTACGFNMVAAKIVSELNRICTKLLPTKAHNDPSLFPERPKISHRQRQGLNLGGRTHMISSISDSSKSVQVIPKNVTLYDFPSLKQHVRLKPLGHIDNMVFLIGGWE